MKEKLFHNSTELNCLDSAVFPILIASHFFPNVAQAFTLGKRQLSLSFRERLRLRVAIAKIMGSGL